MTNYIEFYQRPAQTAFNEGKLFAAFLILVQTENNIARYYEIVTQPFYHYELEDKSHKLLLFLTLINPLKNIMEREQQDTFTLDEQYESCKFRLSIIEKLFSDSNPYKMLLFALLSLEKINVIRYQMILYGKETRNGKDYPIVEYVTQIPEIEPKSITPGENYSSNSSVQTRSFIKERFRLAKTYEEEKKWTSAIKEYKEIADIDKGNIYAYERWLKIILKHLAGNGLLSLCNSIVENVQPNTNYASQFVAESFYILGNYALRHGDFPRSQNLLEQAYQYFLRQDDMYAALLFDLGLAIQKNLSSRDTKYELTPDGPKLTEGSAKISEHKQIIDYYNKSLTILKSKGTENANGGLYISLCENFVVTYMKLGEFSLAQHYCQILEQHYQNNIEKKCEMRLSMAQCYSEMKRYSEALEIYQCIMQYVIPEQQSDFSFYIATLYLKLKDHSQALNFLNRALSLNPQNTKAILLLKKLSGVKMRDSKAETLNPALILQSLTDLEADIQDTPLNQQKAHLLSLAGYFYSNFNLEAAKTCFLLSMSLCQENPEADSSNKKAQMRLN